MTTHFPVLLVLTPLIAAPICLFIRSSRLLWAIGTLVGLVTVVIASTLLFQVTQEGSALSYDLGSWPPPWGIQYRVDELSALLLTLVSGIAFIVLLFAGHSAVREIPKRQLPNFYAVMLLVFSGYLSVSVTNDAFNLFVFFEIASLATYSLVATGRTRQALSASYQYFLMGSLGAGFFLIGIGLLYQQTGTLNFTDLGHRTPALTMSPAIQMSFAFVMTGLALKMALFPLHMWLPNAYCYSPSVVSVLLAAIPTKISFYVLLRFIFNVYSLDPSVEFTFFRILLTPLALLAIVAGSLAAIYQTNLKKLLAYSSIANIGYMALPVSLASISSIQASLVQFFNHTLIATTAFLAAGCIWFRLESTDLSKMTGLGRHMPLTVTALIIAGLGMMGTPLTAGFISKWYLFSTIIEEGWWWLIPPLVLTTILAMVYVWRIVETTYFQASLPSSIVFKEAPWQLLLPTLLMAFFSIYFGVASGWVDEITLQAAQALTGWAP